jgi:hypothetical protein
MMISAKRVLLRLDSSAVPALPCPDTATGALVDGVGVGLAVVGPAVVGTGEVGNLVGGREVGVSVAGACVGTREGENVGTPVGSVVGIAVGGTVGAVVGIAVGSTVGDVDVASVGNVVGLGVHEPQAFGHRFVYIAANERQTSVQGPPKVFAI